MWRSIAEMKNRFQFPGDIVATGPSADHYVFDENKTSIGINRAIILSNEFLFVFVDSAETLAVIEKYIDNTSYICMPIWSREKLNINSPIVQKYQHKILLFAQVYECPAIYHAPDYSLNDILLNIHWGTVQPALHFAKLIGLSSVNLWGMDGKVVNGQMNCNKIAQTFGINKARKQRTISDYAKTRAMLAEISKHLGLSITYCGENTHAKAI